MAGQGGGRRVRARTARRAAQRAQMKIGRQADRRGGRVPLTVAGFEAALRDRGHDCIAEALIVTDADGTFGGHRTNKSRRRQ